MPTFCFGLLESSHWTTWVGWVSLGSGLAVTGLVMTVSRFMLRRRRTTDTVNEDDISWEALLDLLKERYQGENGAAYVESMSPKELLQSLLAEIPNRKRDLVEEFGVLGSSFDERRASRRRWLNPITVSFYTALEGTPHHGIIINRSAGGLAILVDQDFPPDESLFVRPLEAPKSVPDVLVRVCHSRLAGRMYLLGCQYCNDELPWNVKVWFG